MCEQIIFMILITGINVPPNYSPGQKKEAPLGCEVKCSCGSYVEAVTWKWIKREGEK